MTNQPPITAQLDPRKNPRPGDAVQMQKKWTRHVLLVQGEIVTYYSMFHGVYLGPLDDLVSGWLNAVANAEVLHVAD